MLMEPTVQSSARNPSHKASALLYVQREDVKAGVRFAVYIVVSNHSGEAIALTNKPWLEPELFDQSGNRVAQTDYRASGPETLVEWAIVPRDAYLGLRVDDQGVGIPQREQGAALLAIGGKSWALVPGDYTLRAACEFRYDVNGPPHQWVGRFDRMQAGVEIDAITSNTGGGIVHA